MNSCDKLIISEILPQVTYEDMTLFGGISNNLRWFEYANEKVYFPEGRGYIDFTEFILKMGIAYDVLTIEQLRRTENKEDVVIFMPKDLLENIRTIKKATTGINLVYSAFKIRNITETNLTLSINNYKLYYEKTISFIELEQISILNTKPLSYTIKIIEINRNKSNYDKQVMQRALKKQLNSFLTNDIKEIDGTKCLQGPQFYEQTSEILGKLLDDFERKSTRIKTFIFVSTLNAGGEAFYRKDFLTALLLKGTGNSNISVVIEKMQEAVKRWYEVIRILRFAQGGDIQKVNLNTINKLFKEIKEFEIDAIDKLLNKFEALEEVQ